MHIQIANRLYYYYYTGNKAFPKLPTVTEILQPLTDAVVPTIDI